MVGRIRGRRLVPRRETRVSRPDWRGFETSRLRNPGTDSRRGNGARLGMTEARDHFLSIFSPPPPPPLCQECGTFVVFQILRRTSPFPLGSISKHVSRVLDSPIGSRIPASTHHDCHDCSAREMINIISGNNREITPVLLQRRENL